MSSTGLYACICRLHAETHKKSSTFEKRKKEIDKFEIKNSPVAATVTVSEKRSFFGVHLLARRPSLLSLEMCSDVIAKSDRLCVICVVKLAYA